MQEDRQHKAADARNGANHREDRVDEPFLQSQSDAFGHSQRQSDEVEADEDWRLPAPTSAAVSGVDAPNSADQSTSG